MSTEIVLDNRLDAIFAGARSILGADPRGWLASALQGDGSDRKFYRLRRGAQSFIALSSERRVVDGIDENDSYLRIGSHLHERSIPVPRFLWADATLGLFLMEDLGDVHLQRLANRSRVDRARLYRSALSLLAKFHEAAPDGFSASFCFDAPLYTPEFVLERELEYFRNAFLNGYLELGVGEDDLKADFEAIAEASGVREPRRVMHRDFQSRNIMVRGGALGLVDFQGARFGPPAYDLASLLLDPYVALPDELQDALAALYWNSAKGFLDCTRGRFYESYAAVRLSRNLQVLGAYGFLGLVKGKRQFLNHMPRAWRLLLKWLAGPCRGRYPGLERLVRNVERTGALLRAPSRWRQTFP